MSVHVFRSFHSRSSGAGLSAMFAPRKPRHPLLRALLGVVGVLLLAGLLVVGRFVGVAMLAGGLVVRLLRQRGKPVARDPRVVAGECRVADQHCQPLLRCNTGSAMMAILPRPPLLPPSPEEGRVGTECGTSCRTTWVHQ